MKHLTNAQLLHLADLYLADEPYDSEAVESLQHIQNCKDCFDAFCSAYAILQAIDPSLSLRLDQEALTELDADTLPSKSFSDHLAALRVLVQKGAEGLAAAMEQIGDSFGRWIFEPPMSMAGARGADDGQDHSAVASLEDIDSRYTFVRYDAAAGELHIQIDTEFSAEIPERVAIRFPDGTEQELPLSRGDRFITADVRGIPSTSFEIFFF